MSDEGDNDNQRGGYPHEVYSHMVRNHVNHMQHQQHQLSQQDPHRPDSNPTTVDRHSTDSASSIEGLFQAAWDNIWNLSTRLRESKARMQAAYEQQKQQRREEWQRWTGLEESTDHVRMVIERSPDAMQEASSATMMLLREAWKRNAHVPPRKIEALFSDDSVREFDYAGFSRDLDLCTTVPAMRSWGQLGTASRWLSVAWFKRSPYSPINLEAYDAQYDLPFGVCWRRAFEDLLNATLDKPMDSQECFGLRMPNGTPQSTLFGPGLDWMLSLQCRGILPPQLPALYAPRRIETGRGNADLNRDPGRILRLLTEQQGSLNPTIHRDLHWGIEWPEPLWDFYSLVHEIATPSPTDETVSRILSATGASAAWRRDFALRKDVKDVTQRQQEPLPVLETQNAERLRQVGLGPEGLEEGVDEQVEENGLDLQTELDMYERMVLHVLGQGVSPGSYRQRTIKEMQEYQMQLMMMADLRDALLTGNVAQVALHLRDRPSHQSDQEFADTHLSSCDRWMFTDKRYVPIVRDAMALLDAEEEEGDLLEQSGTCPYLRGRNERLQQEAEALGLDEDAATPQPKMRDSSTQTSPADSYTGTTKVDVLSSLTTTQTTRLPDGTVTTKVVLKQRFADGSEETNEKVHTYREDSSLRKGTSETLAEEPKKKGWFWTSS